jgi:hypothetical protein
VESGGGLKGVYRDMHESASTVDRARPEVAPVASVPVLSAGCARL